LSDYVSERNCGLTVGYKDVDGWVDAFSSVIDDQKLRQSLQDNTASLRSEFAWPVVGNTLADYIERVLESTQRAAPLPLVRLPRYVAVQTRRQGLKTAVRKIVQSFSN
jgi:hypothetical protein